MEQDFFVFIWVVSCYDERNFIKKGAISIAEKKEIRAEKNRIFFKKRKIDEWMLKVLFVYLIVMFFSLVLNVALFLKLFYSLILFIAVIGVLELRGIRHEQKEKEKVS